ncbi:hypothetical protein RUM43_013064 [Polyplax serrata]|uniref:Wolframin n=1 Tax=Polyplax serrata TaxID=468196 RepID=A0AAN8NJS9_POLSC
MAGIVPFAGSAPGRRQWNIKDRKTGRQLRSQLAEDGCPESQVVLAKQLLQEKSVVSGNDNNENARLGVFWLIKASEQGNMEATEILHHCLQTGEGITEHNYLDVKACLNTSQNEKLAKRAAREMFMSLSAGQDFITSEQLRKQMNKIDLSELPSTSKSKEGSQNVENDFLEAEQESENDLGSHTRSRDEDNELKDDKPGWTTRSDSFGEKLTEGHLESAASHYSRGELPLVQGVFALMDSQNRNIGHLNYLQRTLLHPLTTVHHTQREYSDFRVWSRLFLRYDRDGNLNTDDAEFEFCKKNLRPYGLYFLSLLFNLVVYPFISEVWIPQSECAIISFALTFLTLYAFHERTSKKIDFLILFSFAINVLAKYPYETDGVVRQTWRFLDIELPTLQSYGLPCFVSQIVGNGVEFCLNFRGFFYLLIPGIFFKMASRDNWRGTYKVLIPHCVTLSWWQIAIFCCKGATLYGLLRSALALVGLVFFLPLAAIATTILPIVAVFKHFADVTFTSKTGITIIMISIPLVVAYYKRQLHVGSKFLKIQIFLAILAALFLLCPPLNSFIKENGAESEIQTQPELTWDQYSTSCQRSSWDKRSEAEMQIGCIGLNGVKINWRGVVENVKVTKVHNSVLKLLDYVPRFLRPQMECYYGETFAKDCTEEEDATKMSLCKLLSVIHPRDKCHVLSWNRYEFEVSIKMNSDKWNSFESTIRLKVDDSMKNFTLKLRPKDHIWFSGTLNYPETIGSENLMILVGEMGCINCSDNNLISVKRRINKSTGQYFAKEIYNGFRRVLNFIFNPIVNFR